MGKGFNNYMTKKFFHPSSKENIKRVWMAQQKTTFEKKKQEDLMNQYQKEQDMLQNRALLGDEKAKLGLSFLYDAPPGLKSKEKEEDEPEYKFEWQRKFNAPREAYAKDDETIRDQPFGIEVRNVRCIKCRQWGHVNTDKICPLYCTNLTAEPPKPENSTSSLVEGLKEEGFKFKDSVLGRLMETGGGKAVSDSEDEDDPEVQFLKSLTPAQKKKLMKKLDRLQSGKKKSKKNKKKVKKSKRKDSDSESSDAERKSHKSTVDSLKMKPRDRAHELHEKKRHSSHDRLRSSSPQRRDNTRMGENRRDERREGQRNEPHSRRERREECIMERERINVKERKRHRYDSSSESERSVDKKRRFSSSERLKVKKEYVTSSNSDSSPVRDKLKKKMSKKRHDSSSESDSSLERERKNNGKIYRSRDDVSPERERRRKDRKINRSLDDISPARERRDDRKINRSYDIYPEIERRRDIRKRHGSHEESKGRKDRYSGDRR